MKILFDSDEEMEEFLYSCNRIDCDGCVLLCFCDKELIPYYVEGD